MKSKKGLIELVFAIVAFSIVAGSVITGSYILNDNKNINGNIVDKSFKYIGDIENGYFYKLECFQKISKENRVLLKSYKEGIEFNFKYSSIC